MDKTENRDDALFEALNKNKKRKKRRRIRTLVIVLLLLAVGLTLGVRMLRRRVTQQFASRSEEVSSAQATRGSISTQVSGSGTLMNVDEESVSIPAGVTVEELLVSAHESVTEGQSLARVEKASVRIAMDSLQAKLDSLDSEISSAASDAVDSKIAAGVAGRVKRVYAEVGEDIASCMVEHGALAVLSLDGWMSVEVPAGALAAGQAVKVVRENGKTLDGTVGSVTNGSAVILVTDNGPELDETVTVLDTEEREIGSGALAVHSPLRISGITGTVSRVYASEEQKVQAGASLFGLTDTSYTARYETLLRERAEYEETLLELINLYQAGFVTAPFTGTVSSVDYDASAVSTDAETALVTLTHDRQMQVTINVDESNILSLELGQTAAVTISSVGDEPFSGSVTEINKTASSSSGVTRYTAVVTLDKTPEMLQGMSAKVVVRIQGVENAVIIPIDALKQTSSRSFVYTSYNEETQEFGGLVEVTVGITNSSYAEIISGLNEGDTVWYTPKAANSFGNMNFPGGFNGSMPGGFSGSGNMPGGFSGSGNRPSGNGSMPSGFSGERPSGGDRPSGNRPGSGNGG